MSATTRLMAISDCVALDALRVGADLKGIAFISSQVVVTCRVSAPDELATIKKEFEFTEQLRAPSAAGGRRRSLCVRVRVVAVVPGRCVRQPCDGGGLLAVAYLYRQLGDRRNLGYLERCSARDLGLGRSHIVIAEVREGRRILGRPRVARRLRRRELVEEPEQLDRYRHDQRAVLFPGPLAPRPQHP